MLTVPGFDWKREELRRQQAESKKAEPKEEPKRKAEPLPAPPLLTHDRPQFPSRSSRRSSGKSTVFRACAANLKSPDLGRASSKPGAVSVVIYPSRSIRYWGQVLI